MAIEEFVINVKGLTKHFAGIPVVDHIDLRVRKGQIHGFLGPNGSGKTTFIRILCGLLRADSGSGLCLGHDVIHESRAIKLQVGYMTQRFSFYEDLTVEENLAFVARIYDIPNRRRIVDAHLKEFGLADRKFQLAGELSGGWKQRMALVCCLLHRPKLLLLDEPTAGVDPMARRDFWETLRALARNGLTILVTTHYMDEAENCDRLACISSGRLLVDGTTTEVINSAGLSTWTVKGPHLGELAKTLRALPGVDQVSSFDSSLRISGQDAALLERSTSPHRREPYQWHLGQTSLEEAFIHLTRGSTPRSL